MGKILYINQEARLRALDEEIAAYKKIIAEAEEALDEAAWELGLEFDTRITGG